jgi:hypothetical protein
VRLALDRDIWVGDAGSEQLPQSTQKEGDSGSYPLLLLEYILQLLKDRVLQYRVDNQYQSRHNTRKQSLRAFLSDQGQQCSHCCRCLRWSYAIYLFALLPCRHPCVDDPDWVCEQDRCGSSNGTRNHRLDGCEPLRGTPSIDSGLLEGSPGPFVPVVVYKVCDSNAEESRVKARIEACDTFSGNDSADSIEEAGFRPFGFNLCAR